MAISVTNLTTFFSATNNGTSPSSYVSASVTLHAGNLGLLAVYSHRTGGAASPSGISGPGSTTWVEITHEDSFTIATPLCRLTLYRACNATDQTGTITVTFAATQSNCFIHCNEVSGSAATSGNNGSDGIQQNAINHTDSAASPFTVTLAAFANSNNAAFGAFAAKARSQSYSAGTGFTGLTDVLGTGTASDSGDLFCEWEINNTAVTATYTLSQTNAGVAVEIIAASAGGIFADDFSVTGAMMRLMASAAYQRRSVPRERPDEESPSGFSPVGVMDDLLPRKTVPPSPMVPAWQARRMWNESQPAAPQPPGMVDDPKPGRTFLWPYVPAWAAAKLWGEAQPAAPQPLSKLDDPQPGRTFRWPAVPAWIARLMWGEAQPAAPQPLAKLDDPQPGRTFRWPFIPAWVLRSLFGEAQPAAPQPPAVMDDPQPGRTSWRKAPPPVHTDDVMPFTAAAPVLTGSDDPSPRQPLWRQMVPAWIARALWGEAQPAAPQPPAIVDDRALQVPLQRPSTRARQQDDGANLQAVVAALTPADDPRPPKIPARPASPRLRADDGVVHSLAVVDDPRPKTTAARLWNRMWQWVSDSWPVVVPPQSTDPVYWRDVRVESVPAELRSGPIQAASSVVESVPSDVRSGRINNEDVR